MRSKLFVPGARPDFFDKALGGDADALSFDLEDSVPESGKAQARERLAEFLRSERVARSGKVLIVRVNALDTPHARDDLAALEPLADHLLINLPKVEDAETVHAAAALTGARLLLNIETSKGLRNAAAIASAHRQVAGLQIGLNDLFASLGCERSQRDAVHSVLWQVRLAAGEAGCFAYDGAWPDLGDEDGFRAEAEHARSLGYRGKSCIHPRQVTIVNAIFARGEEAETAQRLLAAAQAAEEEGRGAFLFEGRMIDRPAIEEARATLRAAGRMNP